MKIIISILFIILLIIFFQYILFRESKKIKFNDLMKINVNIKPKKIVIFYHILPESNWKSIIQEQMSLIISSGLYKKIYKLYCCCCGRYCNKKIHKYLKKFNKCEILLYEPDKYKYEINSINKLIEYSKLNSNNYILYIHTKGVTSKTSYWRKLMNYWNIQRHSECIQLLNKGMNTIGINMQGYLQLPFLYHYSGNFCWLNSDYVKKLDKIDDKKFCLHYRYQAEFIFLSKYQKNKHLSLHGPYLISTFFMKTGLYSLNRNLSEKDKKLDMRIL